MKINIYHWKNLNKAERQALLLRAESDISRILPSVKEIIASVKDKGDQALIDFTKKFDGADLKDIPLKVTDAEFDQAEKEIDKDIKEAIKFSVENVMSIHHKQKIESIELSEVRPGVYAGERFTPIPSAGLYVPRGRGSFPSVMYMLAVPALIAGVERVAAVTPPDHEGKVDSATLYTARLCGIMEIYRVGGAQAIAALAYGTKSIAKVDKIVGPGSIYVSAAKSLLTGMVDMGLPAGPSESIILADKTADPRKAALDLMIEAEHGSDSSAYLVTPSPELADEVEKILPTLLVKLSPLRTRYVQDVLNSYGGIIITEDMKEAAQFVNEYAPEHLQLACRDPFEIMSLIKNAGEILLGQHAAFSLANYSVGVNNVLPTGGKVKTCSPLTVRDFLKSSSVVYITEPGFQSLKGPVAALSEYEGFSAHALAVKNR